MLALVWTCQLRPIPTEDYLCLFSVWYTEHVSGDRSRAASLPKLLHRRHMVSEHVEYTLNSLSDPSLQITQNKHLRTVCISSKLES